MPLAPHATQEQWEDGEFDSESDDSTTIEEQYNPSTARRDSNLKPEDDTWCHLLYVFSQETTFHGVRYVGARTRYIIRRLLWIIVVSLCVGMFLYYMVDRIAEFLKFRTTMAVQEYYVESMSFPSVTICNQNRIRLTAAADGGWYDVLNVINTEPRHAIELRLCEEKEFTCTNKQCITASKRCDSFPDCSDGSDESLCDPCPMLRLTLDSLQFGLPEYLLNVTGLYTFITSSFTTSSSKPITYRSADPNKPFYLIRNNDEQRWKILNGVTPESQDVPLAHTSYFNMSDSTADIPTNWTALNVNGAAEVFSINITCYDGDTYETISSELSQEILNLNLSDIYTDGGHQAKDFIKACTWKKQPCTIDDFTSRGTDLGICYTFNGTNLTAEQAGPGYGLQLSLNIEQYEYTKDMETGVGIKVLLHEPLDEPEMEKAFSISPGLYTMVSIEKTELRNLDPPWGYCREYPLEFYSEYTENNCRVDCLTKDVTESCKCRDIYMPERRFMDNSTFEIPICSVGTYQDCVKPIIDQHKVKPQCQCLKPCLEIMYVTSLSFASIATDDDAIQRRSQEAELHNLISRRSHSREVAFRVHKDKLQQTLRVCHVMTQHTLKLEWYLESMQLATNKLLNKVKELGQLARSDCQAFGIIQSVLSSSLHMTSQSVQRYGDMFYTRLLGNMHNMRYIMTSQSANYSVSENSYVKVEPREVVLRQEDVELILNDVYFNLGATMDVNIRSPEASVKGGAMTASIQDDKLWEYGSQRWTRFVGLRTMYISLMSSIQTLSGDFYKRVVSDIKHLPENIYRLNRKHASLLFANTRSKCDWCVTDEPRTLTQAIRNKTMLYLREQLKPMLNSINKGIMEIYNSYLENNSTESRLDTVAQMDNQIEQARTLYTSLDIELVRTFNNATSVVDGLFRTMAPKCDAEFNYLFDDQHHQQRQFRYSIDALVYHVRLLRTRYSTFQERYNTNDLTLSELDKLYDIEELITFLNGDVRAVTPVMTSLSVLVHKYEFHAKDVIRWIRAQSSETYVVESSTYAQDIRERAFVIMNTLPEPDNTTAAPTSINKGRHLSEDAEDAGIVWQRFYDQLNSFTLELEAHRQTLKSSAKESQFYLTEFIRGNQINEAFFRKNMVQVDVFYKTLANKTVVQQKAYTYPMLLGEIGGLYGLLLGASVLTLFEFIDFFTYNSVIKCQARHRRAKRKKQRKLNEHNHTTSTYSKKNGNHVKV